MPALIITLADAVVNALNDATLSQSFTAERVYVPTYAKQDEEGEDELAELRVSVVPSESSMAVLSRGEDDFTYVVDIGVFKRLADMTNALADPLMTLVEEIIDLFRSRAIREAMPAKLVSVENPPVYSPDHLREHQVFASVVRLGFRKERAR
jgi:hypothetical protein